MPLASKIDLPERYRVARHIANGGMASVWEVEDLLLGRVVAVKVLGAHFASDKVARARFQREARIAAQVSVHPNVVTIYDIGEHGDDAFIVMEHFSGGTVADRLRAARESGKPVARETALRWLREAAGGLDAAHAAGVVHRDVKPANLLLDEQGRVAVADFGIARLADDTHMTQAGQVLGTAAYLSPEQATGQPATAASDRYALAVVAYELLSGSRPFEATAPAAQLLQHVEERPPRASEAAPQLPVAVDAVLQRGLAKDPAGRPTTATQFVDELEGALVAPPQPPTDSTRAMPVPVAVPVPEPPRAREPLAPPPVLATAPTPPARPARPTRPTPAREAPAPASAARRSRLPIIALLALVAVLVGGAVGLALRSGGNGGGAGDRASAGAATTKKPAASKPSPGSAAASGSTQAPAVRPSPAKAATDNPSAANDQGFKLNNAGDYAGAVAPLRAAVQGFRDAGRTDEMNYYFALYNLGVALNRSGSPAEAIPFLQERLRNPNQSATVKRELAAAMAAAGVGGKPGKAPKPGKG